jgi:hypothetical protein
LRAIRWDAGGSVELGHLGTDSGGFTGSVAEAANPSGTAVGYANKFEGDVNKGARAVRWNAGSTAAIELGHLGTDGTGNTSSFAQAINASGTMVGHSLKYEAGVYKGDRAVRWNAGGTVATELGHLGTDSGDTTSSIAEAINASGAVAGQANKFESGAWKGTRAVRWNAGGTAATELAHLGLDSNGFSTNYGLAIDASGTIVGWSMKHESGVYRGDRAVRWDAGSTAATELGNLGTDGGFTNTSATAINASGTAVGKAAKYEAGSFEGNRAVRWDAGSTAATELGLLEPLSALLSTHSVANSINAAGIAVGTIESPTLGRRAVLWGVDGAALDLNTLLSPSDAAMWTLTDGASISDTGWVTGVGLFRSSGVNGPEPEYYRGFLMQIPEPATGMLVFPIVALATRRRYRFGRDRVNDLT